MLIRSPRIAWHHSTTFEGRFSWTQNALQPMEAKRNIGSPRGGTLRISGCGCAARALEPLAYTRASFSWILLPYTRVNSWFPWSSQPTGQFREK